jgi:DNA-binding CsgD family transcriptional regulator
MHHREKQIIQCLSDGMSLEETAKAVFLSLRYLYDVLARMRDEHDCVTTIQLVCKLSKYSVKSEAA